MVDYKIIENKTSKALVSDAVNYYFSKATGFTATWGKTKEEDAIYSPFGPLIADIEISTICHGVNGTLCPACYKTNSSVGRNMSLETFKKLLDKFFIKKVKIELEDGNVMSFAYNDLVSLTNGQKKYAKYLTGGLHIDKITIPVEKMRIKSIKKEKITPLTQVAFGIGTLGANPEMWSIMEYCKENGVIPNITINGGGLTAENADKLVALCGAVAVSKYNPKDVCYDAVKMLTDRGLNQCNIHMILSQDTYDACFEVIRDSKEDKRLEKLNAIVFLMLKPRGDRNKLRPLQDLGKYKKLVEFAFENNVRLGFDSCSAHMFLKAVKDNPNFTQFKMAADPCESTCFSIYVNVDGKVFPCSFCDGEKDWENGIDLKVYNNMLDVWNSEKIVNWRKKLLKNGRKCPMFNLDRA